jgi:acetylornithine deacetylase/succinyl-diaminopimelate desuccinylase-like protein
MGARLLTEVEGEVTTLLSDLIRINTTNPPGNETQAAKYLAQTSRKRRLQMRGFGVRPRKRKRHNTP